MTLKVEGTLAELRELFLEGAKTEAKRTAKSAGKKAVKVATTRTKTAWDRFLKSFKFRSRRKSEKPSAYLSARSKAAGRAYRKKNSKSKRRKK